MASKKMSGYKNLHALEDGLESWFAAGYQTVLEDV